jgi:hypothetical protein
MVKLRKITKVKLRKITKYYVNLRNFTNFYHFLRQK